MKIKILVGRTVPASFTLKARSFIQRPLGEFISYKFRANNASLQELSQFTRISIEIQKGLL